MALTIAGSDSSGGAGIQADLKTFHCFGVYGMSAITALTAQNTTGVAGIFPVDPAFVALQIDTTVADIAPDAVKTGMLANREIVETVADAATRHGFPFLVVDPVMVATTGAPLLEEDAVGAILERLVPIATLITPNAPEASLLTGRPVTNADQQQDAARALVEERGARAVLLKGGDLRGKTVVDVLYDGTEPLLLSGRRIASGGGHGAGCALASAIAALLARGEDLAAAVESARAWVRRGLESAPPLGRGLGPLDLTHGGEVGLPGV